MLREECSIFRFRLSFICVVLTAADESAILNNKVWSNMLHLCGVMSYILVTKKQDMTLLYKINCCQFSINIIYFIIGMNV